MEGDTAPQPITTINNDTGIKQASTSAIRKKDFFKQKVAMFFGYNGTAYRGLQKQKYDANDSEICLTRRP